MQEEKRQNELEKSRGKRKFIGKKERQANDDEVYEQEMVNINKTSVEEIK